MIKSFFTSAFRHLIKNKSYAALNIFGLSIGLACFTLIGLWVQDELSFDRFHSRADRIYRVANHFSNESGHFEQAITPLPLGPALLADLPEVDDVVRIDPSDAIVSTGEKSFPERDILAVDASFFKVFDFKLLSGSESSVLTEPYTVVLSESMARKYFGNEDPVGKSVRMYLFDPGSKGAEYKVTGVAEDCPANSHFAYRFLISFKTVETYRPDLLETNGWFDNGYHTYMLVKQQTDMRLLNAKLSTFLEKYVGRQMKENKNYWAYFTQPITDIHLKSNLRYEIKATSSMSYVTIFGTVGLIVLMLACINYVNLSTAYATERLREAGVRKMMGAFRTQLIYQHLIESWVLTIVSLMFAFTWIELSRPLFESLTGKEIIGLYTLETLITLFIITSATGILSGIYPALVVSSARTVNILKGALRSGATASFLRKTLVVMQYAVTLVLVVGIIVVQLQLRYINQKDLGYDKENLLILNGNGSREVERNFEAFSRELVANPDITAIARSNTMIAGGLGNSGATAEDATGKIVNSTVFRLFVDHEYIDAYGMTLIAGRNFIKGNASDSARAFVINEATTKLYGYEDPADMVGKQFTFNGIEGEVIGVVKDFHYNTLRHKIEPMAMLLLRRYFSRISVRISGNLHENVAFIEQAWKKHYPESILDYSFAEQRLTDQYNSEQRFSKIFVVFSVISLAIACLGLFALVSYSVASRTKEIGIRKVLGASVMGIATMLSKEFVLLVLLACVLATPVGYYFMDQWLQEFEYRISLNAGIFLVAGLTATAIAAVTVGGKSILSAMANPVDSIRTE